jgi:hypothetical protein
MTNSTSWKGERATPLFHSPYLFLFFLFGAKIFASAPMLQKNLKD